MLSTSSVVVASNPWPERMVRSWLTLNNGEPWGHVVAVLASGVRYRVQHAYISSTTGALMLRCRESWHEDGVECYETHQVAYSAVESLEMLS